MNYATSRSIRRYVGRLSKGERVIESLERLCRREHIRAGAITAVGILRTAQIQSYTPDGGYRTVLDTTGNLELVAFNGNISTLGDQIILNCAALLTAVEHGQFLQFGGRLFEAEVLTFEFAIDAWDDLVLERRLDARTGLPVWNKIESLGGEHVREPLSTSTITSSSPQIVAHAPELAPAPASAPSSPALPITTSADRPALTPAPTPAAPTTAAPPTPAPAPAPPAPVESSAEEPNGDNGTRRTEAFTADGAVITRPSTPEIVRRPGTRPAPVVEPEPDESNGNGNGAEPAPAALDWSQVSQASERLSTAERLGISNPEPQKLAVIEEWPDTPDIQVGEHIKHDHFGICKVLLYEEDEYIRVRTRAGKVIDIKLSIVEISRSGEHQGKPLYVCRVKRGT